MRIDGIPFELTRWDGSREPFNCFYVFVLKDQVVYVGSTGNLALRELDCRRSEIKRDAVYYVRTGTRGEAYDCEAWLINTLKPRCNTMFHGRKAPPIPYPPFFLYGNSITFTERGAA